MKDDAFSLSVFSTEISQVGGARSIPERLGVLWLHNEESPLLRKLCGLAQEGLWDLHDIVMCEYVLDVLTD